MTVDINAEELLRRYANGERLFKEIWLADGSVLDAANLQGTTFENGGFSSVYARRANLQGTTFRNMNLKCTDFRGADLTDAVFEGVSIERAAFKGAIVNRTVFTKMYCYSCEIENFCADDWDWADSPV